MSEKMAATIKNWNRKTIAVVLAVVMVVSVFAGTSFFALIKANTVAVNVFDTIEMQNEIKSYSNGANSFDFSEFAGEHYSSGKRRATLDSRLNAAPPAEEYINSVYSNVAFQAARLTWGAANWITNPVGETGDAISEYIWGTPAYYEAIILKMVTDVAASNNFISIINNKDIQAVKKIKKSLGDALDQYNYKYVLDRNVLISDLSDDEKVAVVEAADSFVKKEHENILAEEELSVVTDHVNTMISTVNSIDEFYKKVNTYMSLQKVSSYMVDYLKSMQKIAKQEVDSRQARLFAEGALTTTPAGIVIVGEYNKLHEEYIAYYGMYKALDDVIFMCETSETGWLGKYAVDTAIQSGKKRLTKYLQTELKNSIVESATDGLYNLAASSIALNTAQITIAVTKTLLNVAFSTDSILDKLETTKCLIDLEKLSARELSQELSHYDKSMYSTSVLLEGIDFHYKLLEYDRTLILDIFTLNNSRLSGWLSSIYTTEEERNDIKKSLENEKTFINQEYQSLALPAGNCSDTTSWAITTNGTLLIYGFGEMADYKAEGAPWYEFKNDITRIDIESDISSIGAYSFYGLDKVESDIILDSDYILKESCFNNIKQNISLLSAKDLTINGEHNVYINIFVDGDFIGDGGIYVHRNVNINGDLRDIYKYFVLEKGSVLNVDNLLIDGGIFRPGTFNVRVGAYCHASGDIEKKGGRVYVYGTLEIDGNWLNTLEGLNMTLADSHLIIHGNIGTEEKPANNYGGDGTAKYLTNGVMELMGNQYGRIETSENHVLVLNGTDKQSISYIDVANLRLENQSDGGIVFSGWNYVRNTLYSSAKKIVEGRLLRLCGNIEGTDYYGDFRLDNGACIDHDITVHGTVYVYPNAMDAVTIAEPGVTINIDRNLNLNANGTYGGNVSTLIIPKGVTVNVKGNVPFSGNFYSYSNWMVQQAKLQIDGILNVDGNFTTGDNGYASLVMSDEDALLKIKGNYVGYQLIPDNVITAGKPSRIVADITGGTIDVSGTIDKLVAGGTSTVISRGSKITESTFSDNCTVKMNSSKKQTISNCTDFAILELNHNNGLSFSSDVNINVLFNHNRNKFTLYNSGTGSTFVDYDGDGMLDNVDPYPMDPNNSEQHSSQNHNYVVIDGYDASCTESGYFVYQCTECGATYETTIDAYGHSYLTKDYKHIYPTCTSNGKNLKICSRCGDTQLISEVSATGHDYGAISGKAYIETIYDSNNRFVDSLSYTPNTVTKNTVGSTAIGNNSLLNAGWMTLPREIRLDENNLDVIEDYYIARQRHLLSFSAQVEMPAAFAYKTSTGRAPEYSAIPYTDDKGNLYTLEGEGVVFSLTKAEAEEKGILNGDGTVNVPEALKQGYIFAYSAGLPGTYISLPEFEFISGFSGWNTPTQVFHYDGKGTAKPGVYTVNYCFYNEHQSGTAGTTIKVYDYAALNTTSPAKNGSPATVQHKCIDCGEVITEELGFDEALKLKSSSLSLGNNLIMNFKVSKDALEGYEAPYLEVTRNGKVTTLREYAEQGDNYVFSFTNIAPQTMNDEMTAVLYATKEGKLYASTEVKTSVKKYLYNILNAYSADKYGNLRTLLVDLLNYGASAQRYTNYKTDSLVTADLTVEQKQWASSGDLEFNNITNAAYETVDNPLANWKSASLILDNAVTVRYKFTAENLEGLSLKVQYGKNEKVLDSSSFEDLGDGVYSVKFNGLSAHQLKDPLYATFYKDGEAVSNTLAYSVESYAAQVRENNPESTLDDLMLSLMRYGNSAVNYKKG